MHQTEHGTTPVVTELALERPTGCPFDPPAALGELREQAPLARMRYPDGHLGWLATGYEAIRAIVADRRFSSRIELMHLPFVDGPDGEPFEPQPAPVGDLSGLDAPEHTRYRRLLAGKFTVRRMRVLTERVEEITRAHLDAMERSGPGAELLAAYAYPVPALMICELLGVPEGSRDVFTQRAARVFDPTSDLKVRVEAFEALGAFIAQELVPQKRAAPTDDVLSELTTSDLTDEELAGVAAFLLAAGLDTTTNMIGLGTYALLTHPEQAAALRENPELAPQAVEELLRYLTIAHTGIRVALEDVEVAGQLVRAGESVTFSLGSANRDPQRFPDPDALDLRRNARGQLAFGHGPHQCLGQQLARVELEVALPALFTRFPTLRLDIPADQVPLRGPMSVYGVLELPVTWDGE
ncbi:cytochrome P450 [Streptomyces sp. NPDC002851]